MSRIGKKIIELPSKVEIALDSENMVSVKGPKGSLSQKIHPSFKLNVEGAKVTLERPSEDKVDRSLHGLYRSLINNMVVGVSQGYKVDLELVGVGFKASSTGNVLELALGYSHGIFFVLPKEVTVSTLTEKGKNPTVTLESIDKQLIGHIAAKIRSLRKVEPYKGKGVRFVGEQVRRKAGKTSAK
jgi:large subunit ribosomal protein L6